MSKTVAGVPESITRQQYIELIESLGFDPNRLRTLNFTVDHIYAEVIAENDNGNAYIAGPNEIAIHRIYITIDDRPAPADWNGPPGQYGAPPPDPR